MAGLVQPFFHVAGHNHIEDLFAVLDRLIHDFGIVGVGHALFDRAVERAHNFQEMLVYLVRVGCCLWHTTSNYM